MSLRMWAYSGAGFRSASWGGNTSYHNGGVEGSAFSDWYNGHLKNLFDGHGHGHGRHWSRGGTKGSGSGGTKGSGGTGGSTTTLRESFEWDLAPDPDDNSPVDNYDDLSAGFTQNTGNVDVTFSVLSNTDNVVSEFYTQPQFTDDIVADGAAVDNTSALSSYLTAENASASYELEFSDEVSNVSFRINDVDADAIVRLTAFDADGNAVTINLTAGSAITLTDTDTVTGNDTADSQGDDVPSATPEASLLVDIPGPVSRIVIDHDQDGPDNTGIDVTDVYFDVTVEDDDGDCGSGGTKGSGTGGTWGGTKGSGTGGTKGSGTGGTKGSGTGGTKGSGSGGTKGSGSGGTKGSGSGGTKGDCTTPHSAASLLPAYTGDAATGPEEDTVIYAATGDSASGGTSGPGLNDIMALMTLEPDDNDPALKASASAGLWGSSGTGDLI